MRAILAAICFCMLAVPAGAESYGGPDSIYTGHANVYAAERTKARHVAKPRRHVDRGARWSKRQRGYRVASLGAVGSFAGHSLIASMRAKIGQGRPRGCPHAWCGCALALELGGGSWRAIDWARHGSPAPHGAVGSIAVMRHHVGVVTGSCSRGVMLVSGNGGGSRYTEGCYPASRIVAYRWP